MPDKNDKKKLCLLIFTQILNLFFFNQNYLSQVPKT